MPLGGDFKSDPVYRAIPHTDELKGFEGLYQEPKNRLESINNLGVLSHVLDTVEYSKYQHTVGTHYQVTKLLELDDEETIPERYHAPLKIASLFLHTGHFPLTYESERALLLTSQLGDREEPNEAREFIETHLDRVWSTLELDEDYQQRLSRDLYTLRRPERLYRVFSADRVIDNWDGIVDQFEGVDDDDELVMVGNIANPQSDGFQWLDIANHTDYVLRDALYLGTVQLDVSPRHLYSDLASYQPGTDLEQFLIHVNQYYLEEEFYKHEESRWYLRLFEKCLAGLFLSTNFRFEWLKEFDDERMWGLILEDQKPSGERAGLPRSWREKLLSLVEGEPSFHHISELTKVSLPSRYDRIDVEYLLTGKNESQRGLLQYPFKTGVLFDIQYRDPGIRDDTPEGLRWFDLSLYRNPERDNLEDILRIPFRLDGYLSISNVQSFRSTCGRIFSWGGGARFDNNDVRFAVQEALTEIGSPDEIASSIESYIDEISEKGRYSTLWETEEFSDWRSQALQRVNYDVEELAAPQEHKDFVEGLSALPHRLRTYESTKPFIGGLEEALQELIEATDDRSKKGEYFEALCLLNRLSDEGSDDKLLLNGLVVTDPSEPANNRDQHEYDIVEVVSKGDSIEVWVYACSISDNYRANNRESLRTFGQEVHDDFPSATIRCRYLIPSDEEEGDWTPQMEETGVNFN